MHELSLAIEVCRIAESRLEPGDVPRLRAVGVDLGATPTSKSRTSASASRRCSSAPPFEGRGPSWNCCPGDDLRVAYLEVDDGRPDD